MLKNLAVGPGIEPGIQIQKVRKNVAWDGLLLLLAAYINVKPYWLSHQDMT